MTVSEFDRELANVKSTLFSFALKLTQDYQDAQDLFQEATARGFRYCGRFEMGTNFRAWMSTILRNTFINKYRARQKRRTVNEPIETFTYAIENKNIVANRGEMNMRLQELYDMLDQLKDIYRTPFLMHFQGYEYKEIAEQLDLPIGTIKSRLHTARTKLKAMITERDRLPAEQQV